MTSWKFDQTTDPSLRTWVPMPEASPFPIQALPYGVVRTGHHLGIAVRIGNHALLLPRLAELGYLGADIREVAGALRSDNLLSLINLGPGLCTTLRRAISALLQPDNTSLRAENLQADVLIQLDQVEVLLPLVPPNYTDFYASIYHAQNVGTMLRPDSPLMPNYRHLPVGYHGRASSIVVSGTPIRRPRGQLVAKDGDAPVLGPTGRLDYELELGVIIGRGNTMGEPIAIDDAWKHVFGVVVVNDWSARDIQRWEYQPLGPFLAKNFATSVSGWVLPSVALEPFACSAAPRTADDPALLSYLRSEQDQVRGGLNIEVFASLLTSQMRQNGQPAQRISAANFQTMYWTFAQMIAHHTITGCNLQPGDLLASGTVSGPATDSGGCLLELTWDRKPGSPGRNPLVLASGESRAFLQDGDEVVLEARAQGPYTVALGEVRGTILPSLKE